MKRTLLTVALISFSLAANANENPAEAAAHAVNHHAAHWGYEGETGPSHWAEMSDEFTLCGAGENQSPIDVAGDFDVELPAIKFNYSTKPTKIVNNGHTVQVDIAAGSSMTVNGKTFQLKQFHFHTPSENTINGKQYPLEAHYVHRSDSDNSFAVISVMFEEGEANPVLDQVWEKMPAKARETVELETDLDFTQLRPEDTSYYYFNGSLTTPPCTEGIYWHVMKKPLTASKEQIEKFLAVMQHPNNRPVQKTGARVVVE